MTNSYAQAKDLFSKSFDVLHSLERVDRIRIFTISIVRILANLLDLLGLLLFAILGSLIFNTNGGKGENGIIHSITQALGIYDFSRSRAIIFCSLLAAGFFLFKSLLSMRLLKSTVHIVANTEIRFSERLIHRWINSDPESLKSLPKQQTIFSLLQSLNALISGQLNATITIISEFSFIIILFIGLLLYNPIITLAVTIYFGLILLIIQKKVLRNIHNHTRIATQGWTNSATQIEDLINVYSEISVAGLRNKFQDKLTTFRRSVTSSTAETEYLVSTPRYIVEGSLYIGLVLLTFPIMFSVDVSTVAQNASVFLISATRLIPSLLPLQQSITNLKIAMTRGESAGEFIQRFDHDFKYQVETSELPMKSDYILEMHGVSVRKASGDFILKNISLAIEPGKYVSVVGPSGAGKTTLIECVLGLRNIDEGSVSVLGNDPKYALINGLSGVAYVPQDVHLIHGTFRENLLLDKAASTKSDSELSALLDQVKLLHRVNQLSNGLNSIIGSGDEKFSGGEIQRIGIARALVRDPQVLILDEATSALDPVTESIIQDLLKDRKVIRSVIAIAHKINTVVNSDLIIYLKNGEIQGQGNFRALVDENIDFRNQIEIMKQHESQKN